jgi:hypothetical protein
VRSRRIVEGVERKTLLALKQRRTVVRVDSALARDDDPLAHVFALLPPILRETLKLLAAIFAGYPVPGQHDQQDRRRRDFPLDNRIEEIAFGDASGIPPNLRSRLSAQELVLQLIVKIGHEALDFRRIRRLGIVVPRIGQKYLGAIFLIRHGRLSIAAVVH